MVNDQHKIVSTINGLEVVTRRHRWFIQNGYYWVTTVNDRYWRSAYTLDEARAMHDKVVASLTKEVLLW